MQGNKRVKSESPDELSVLSGLHSPRSQKRPKTNAVAVQPEQSDIGQPSGAARNHKRPTRGTASYVIPKDISDLAEASIEFSIGLSRLIMASTHSLARDGQRVLHVRRQGSEVLLDWILDYTVLDEVSQGNIPMPAYNPEKIDEDPQNRPTLSLLAGSSAEPLVISDSDSENDGHIASNHPRDDREDSTDGEDVDELVDDISEHFASSTIESPPRRPAATSSRPPPSPQKPQNTPAQSQKTNTDVHIRRGGPSGSQSRTNTPTYSVAGQRQPSSSSSQKTRRRPVPRSPSSSPAPLPAPPAHHGAARTQAGHISTTHVGFPVIGPSRVRRLLAPHNLEAPLVTVAMSGDLQFIDRRRRQCISQWSLPRAVRKTGESYNVQDAFIVGPYGVIGYRDPPRDQSTSACEISILSLDSVDTRGNYDGKKRPIRCDITAEVQPVKGKDAGISALAPAGYKETLIKFLSGGVSGQVYLWKVSGKGGEFRAKTQALSWRLPSSVTALAAWPRANAVYGASYGRILVADLERGTNNPPDIVSNQIYHIHPLQEKLVLLEVNSLEEQMQLFDLREQKFNQTPVLRFGRRHHREDGDDRREYRYTRGSAFNTYFARGYKDGVVRMWDIRMVNRDTPTAQVKTSSEVELPIMHVVFPGPSPRTLAALTTRRVTFFDSGS